MLIDAESALDLGRDTKRHWHKNSSLKYPNGIVQNIQLQILDPRLKGEFGLPLMLPAVSRP
ncbi:MAG: hypothetical protein CM1200mP41_15010 [Gammaproteobacteria bacterium]|nr:MAG: hypothetical protein CM1200mP41_15010 [Gammaproteobacteria bacterium]